MSTRRGALLSISLASGVAAFLLAQGIFRAVTLSPHFLVEEVEVRWPNGMPQRYRLRPPTSIFQIRLQEVARALSLRHPTLEVEAVHRVLPNRLVAFLRVRRVVAQLRADRYYPISDDGTLVHPGRPNPWPHLPILFLENVKGPLQVGQSLRGQRFWKASELLATARGPGGIAGHGISSIQAKGKNLLLTLDSGLEIRFTNDHLNLQWQRLTELIHQRPQILDQARYLDLRFEDPVIGDGRPKGSRRS